MSERCIARLLLTMNGVGTKIFLSIFADLLIVTVALFVMSERVIHLLWECLEVTPIRIALEKWFSREHRLRISYTGKCDIL